jgi:hypothetical protein
MIKRRQGAHIHARTYHSQCRELRLIVLIHNMSNVPSRIAAMSASLTAVLKRRTSAMLPWKGLYV